MAPKVSFVVPCYKLAHLLSECVNSILSQTYENLEVIIMDDCSPDGTSQTVKSFRDSRVRYIRNETNLGHLRNYNEGIGHSVGEYIWLISADDRLRAPYILERYLQVMESTPEIGFAFCPGLALEGEKEKGIVEWAAPETHDTIFEGREFLRKLLDQNCVLAPSALVRRRCYETISMFPLDLPFAADWYLWCVFALHYDVAYFAEPMVNYRMHDLGMTNILIDKDVSILSQDDLAVRWRLKGFIEKAGFNSLAELCEDRIVGDYIANLTSSRLHKGTKGYESSGQNYVMNFAEFEHSLITNARDSLERDRIHHRVLVGIGSRFQLAFRQSAGTPGRWFRYIWRAARNPQLLINYISFVASKRSPMQRGSKDGGP